MSGDDYTWEKHCRYRERIAQQWRDRAANDNDRKQAGDARRQDRKGKKEPRS